MDGEGDDGDDDVGVRSRSISSAADKADGGQRQRPTFARSGSADWRFIRSRPTSMDRRHGGLRVAAARANDAAKIPFVLRTLEERIFGGPAMSSLPQRERLQEVNQGILAAEGVHGLVLAFLEREFAGVRTREDYDTKFSPPMLEVFRTCFLFLFYFTWGNEANREALSTRPWVRLLLRQLAFWDGIEVACLLANVLRNNGEANHLLNQADVEMICELFVDAVKEEAAKQSGPKPDAARAEPVASKKQSFGGFSVGDSVEALFGTSWWLATVKSTEPFVVVYESDSSEVTVPEYQVATKVRQTPTKADAEKYDLESFLDTDEAWGAAIGKSDVDLDAEFQTSDGGAGAAVAGTDLGAAESASSEDWRRATSLVQLIKSVVESKTGPIEFRQNQVVSLLESKLRMKAIVGTRGMTHAGDRQLLAALLLQPQPAQAIGALDEPRKPFPPTTKYSFARVEAKFEELMVENESSGTAKQQLPPRAFKDAKEWEQFHRGNGAGKHRELVDTEHLAFHLQFVDLLAMLAKGDNVDVEKWVSYFVPDKELLAGIQTRHGRLRGIFVRFLHGRHFCRQFDAVAHAARLAAGGGRLEVAGLSMLLWNFCRAVPS